MSSSYNISFNENPDKSFSYQLLAICVLSLSLYFFSSKTVAFFYSSSHFATIYLISF